MKELYAQNVLGERYQKKCGLIEVYIPFVDTLNRQRLDFPLISTEASFFERGLKFFSEKLGNFILFFSEVTSVTIVSAIDNPWAVFTLKENLFFSKLTQPYICLRFSKEAQKFILLRFKELLPLVNIKVEDSLEFPEFMKKSLTLQLKGVVKSPTPKDINLLESSEMVFEEEFIKFNTQLQKLKVLSQDDHAIIDDEDVLTLLDPTTEDRKQLDSTETRDQTQDDQLPICLFFIVGPPFSGKRQFSQSVYDHRSKFPNSSQASFVLVSYEDSELHDLTFESYRDRIIGLVNDSNEEERIVPGDWIFVVVPHTISHLDLVKHFKNDKKFSVEACVAKLNINDFYTKNQKPIHNLRRYLEEGYTDHCFADYEGMDSSNYSGRMMIIEEAFPHVKFHETNQNKLLWSRLQHTVCTQKYEKIKRKVALKYNVAKYEFGEEIIRLDYRIPILEEHLNRFKEVIIDYEGALLNPEPEPEPEPEERIRERMKNLRIKTHDELMESMRKLKSIMRGLIAKRDQSEEIPFITRMKGVFRFEGSLEKGPYSLYISPYGFYFENLGIKTELKALQKNDVELTKSIYDGFEFTDLGFYIYGKNLDPKNINYWFNKNLLQVIAYYLENRPKKTFKKV